MTLNLGAHNICTDSSENSLAGKQVAGNPSDSGGATSILRGKVKKEKWQLYIWDGIRCDYSCGIAFAVGRTKEEAIEAIHKVSEDWEWDCYAGELLIHKPTVHDFPYGGWVSGGG